MVVVQCGSGGGAGPSGARADPHLSLLQPAENVAQAGPSQPRNAPAQPGRNQQPLASVAGGSVSGAGAAPVRGADVQYGAGEPSVRAPPAAAPRMAQPSGDAERVAASIPGAAAPVVGLDALLAHAEQSSRLVFSLQVAEPLMRTAQHFEQLKQAFEISLVAACGARAAVEEVAILPKPEQRGVRTVQLLAFVAQPFAERLCIALTAGVGGLQVSVAGADAACLAMLHTREPACRPLYLFTLETSRSRYQPKAMRLFIQANGALFGGIQLQWIGRVCLTGRRVVERVDCTGAALPDCDSPARFPGTTIGLAVGGEGVLQEVFDVPLPRPNVPNNAVPAQAQQHAVRPIESFLLRRVPNRATDTPPMRWHRRAVRAVTTHTAHTTHVPVVPRNASPVTSQQDVQAPAPAAPQASNRQTGAAAAAAAVPASAAAPTSAAAPASHTARMSTVQSNPGPSIPNAQLTVAVSRPGVLPRADPASLAIVPYHPPAPAPLPPPSPPLSGRQAPPQLMAGEAALPAAPMDVVMVAAQPVANTGVVSGALRVVGGASQATAARSRAPELATCGSWVQVGGDSGVAKVGLVVAHVWSVPQHRMIPRVVLGSQSTPAWRDVAASSLRVVSELSVGLSTKQEVGMAIQAHGEQLFTNASIAITDWPSTQVMFPPGYMPPVVPEQHGRRPRQAAQMPSLVQLTATAARRRRSRPAGPRSARQPHSKVQRRRSVDSKAMETATDDSTYADNGSRSGSDADRYAECNRYEYRDPSTRPAQTLALLAPPTGRIVSGRGPPL